MRDCYKILGVSKNATASEIRRAYRKKAKLLHPDMNPELSEKNAEEFRELVAAYETLSDAKARNLFDQSSTFHQQYREQHKGKDTFDYRSWLKERDDDESHAKLVFYELLNHNEDEAVREFKTMNMTRPGFKLSRWFTREDFMDYGFILCEELVIRQEYYDAVILLSQIIKMNYSYDYFRMFFPEVKNLARHILRNNIEGQVNDELAIDAWEQALDLNFGKEDDAYFLQKMGDAYERIGDAFTAQACRQESTRLVS